MQTKGFTLIEMLITLSALSIFILLLPMLRPSARIALRYETKTLKERLLQAQGASFAQKKEIPVDFHGNYYTIADQVYTMNTAISCTSTPFHFTPQGNVSNALTIHCSSDSQTSALVIQLGSGRIHEK